MAITTEQLNNLLTVVVGMFDGAPTNAILNGLAQKVDNGTSIPEVANQLAETAEFKSIYNDFLPDETFAAQFAESLLGNTVDSATKAEGADFIEGLLNSGSSRGEAVFTAINALSNASEDDAKWGDAAAQLNNKVEVAYRFVVNTSFENMSMEELRAVVADVNASDESAETKKELIDAGILDAEAQLQRLTTGEDILTGTSLPDMFKAKLGTLDSLDEIDGGAGKDILKAVLDNTAAIDAELNNIEVVKFTAQDNVTNNNTSDNQIPDDFDDLTSDQNDDAQVDARKMFDTYEFWNVDSRADLVIEDVRHNSHETRLVMQDTDPGDVDYAVYFDDQHITAPGATQANSQLFLELLDLEAAADTGEKLTNNPYKGVVIFVDGEKVELVDDAAINASNLGREPTYQDIVNALNFSLNAQGFNSITASLGEEFNKANSDDGLRYTGTTIVLTNEGSEQLSIETTNDSGNTVFGGWLADGAVPPSTNIHTNISDVPPEVTTSLTQVDIDLDNVGRGSEAGDFRAGNMSTGSSDSQGIQQFNVTVHDSSWITSMSTTNDGLEEVYVVNSQELVDMAPAGDLRIGDNKDENGYTGLQNVRVFDASAMTGAVTLEADLDDAVIGKYFDLEDDRAAIEIDNIQFDYTLTAQDDIIELTVSEEAVSYEDFELTIESGAGDDEVIFEVTGTEADNLDTRWNEDQAALDNVMISTGAGNDTVRAIGDGEVTITTGSGNDVVYSDNSGLTNTNDNVATWVFNSENLAINDIEGSGVGSNFFLLNGKLTVTFSAGQESDGSDNVTSDVADLFDNGFEATVSIDADNYVSDEGDINQALKEAINQDPTLNKWLLAEDGPNNSVVVTALVDGVFADGDLEVVISQDAFPATVSTTIQDAYEEFKGDSTVTYDSTAHTNELDAAQASGRGYDSNSVLATSAIGAEVEQTTQGEVAVDETQTIDFAGVLVDAAGAGDITVGGVTVTLANGDNAAAIAAAVETAVNGSALTAPNTGATTVTAAAVGSVVTITYPSTLGDVTNATVALDTATLDATSAVLPTAAEGDKGNVAVAEVQTFDFADVTAEAGETIIFTVDGTDFTYTNGGATSLSGDALEADIAANLAVTNYTFANGASTGDLTLTQDATFESDIALVTLDGTASGLDTITLTGVASDEEANDNTINVGTGNDVVALSTNGNSNETLVFTGYNQGNVDVLNFTTGTDAGQDVLDFDAYLNTMVSPSGSTASELLTTSDLEIGATVDLGGNDIGVIQFNTVSGQTSETFAGLNASNLLAAINNSNSAGAADYGTIGETTVDAEGALTDIVGDVRDSILMVENGANLGEYKVFHLTSSDDAQTGTTTGNFSEAMLIGTVDLGGSASTDGSGTQFTADNFTF